MTSRRSAYHFLFDHALSRVDPERAHHVGFRGIRLAATLVPDRVRVHGEPVEAFGLHFENPLGLAAGFDKNGVGIDALAALGFGHVEVGTVTAQPQLGNPRPRLFRLAGDRAIVNRMGFNNDGAEVVARRLAARTSRATQRTITRRSTRNHAPLNRQSGATRRRVVVGVNIGKSKVVPEDDAAAVLADYQTSTGLLASHADYLVVNVSSPNTPGLRSLQSVERLEPLLEGVRRRADIASPERRVPLLVKIAPDLADDDVLAVADLALALRLDGVIATNTTIARSGLVTPDADVELIGPGGLSGPPLAARALDVLRLLKGRVGDRVALVAVGGITTPADARTRLDAGAALVQAYTAFIYEGPAWPRRMVRGLSLPGGQQAGQSQRRATA